MKINLKCLTRSLIVALTLATPQQIHATEQESTDIHQELE